MHDMAQVLGLFGGLLVVFSYYLLVSKRVTSESAKYHAINLVGALLLLFSLYFKPNLGSILIEFFFIMLAAKGLKDAKGW